ncbi:Ribosomal protein S6 kinase alpha-5 [Trachymyrmex septentrionalis]|uniref:non-specific serine/threonine protein kinase n=1 Tax=Trachymyrmex septentrionalis TaxID=34720 RepID=A0A195ES93_9HYME|nr:PREDICTED: ribosomal protein S6 kinase alpha-5-like isoform X1 [Trachymyrmex septentrionalis]KYN31041.1 Ribosomal protein S6 kinase alpha-5 [Trachymyrmex septentrionalis]
MEEDESLVQATDSVSIPSKKESGYFEENCGDLSDVIFSNYNHYGALLSVDTAGILIINETRRSDHWEESRQGSSFSSGLVEDINDLDVNDTDEVKDDIVIIKHPEEARRDVTDASDVVHSPEGSKEFLCTHEDSAAVLRIPENHEKNIDSEVPVCIHANSKAVVYIRKSPEVIDCTKEDSTSVECATSPSTIAEDWNDAELSVCDTVNLADNGSQKVDMTHFDLLRVLGTGAYGKVFLVRKRTGADSGRLYAMKVLKKASIVQKKKTTEHTKSERQILEAIRDSPFLITLYYAFQTDDKLCLILEYVAGGEMFTHLYQHDCFTEDAVRFYIGEIILALERLHDLGVIYRDIKLENILLDKEGHLVLTDFGLSKEFLPHERNGNARTYSFCGTIEYMAPEVVKAGPNGHDIAVDWWSVGVLTFELLTGASPFTVEGEKNNQQEISRRILKNNPPPMPSHLSANVSDFITRLLIKDPRQRLGGGPRDAKELKEHPFFMDAAPAFTWEGLEKKQIKPPLIPKISHELDTSNFSDEFTKMNVVVDSPAVIDGDYPDKHFRGYSYVAPSILFTDNVVSRDIFGGEASSQRPLLSDLLNTCFEESTFFQTYELDQAGPALGDGSFSICRRCRNRKTQQEYAVKIVSRRVDCSREENLLRACQRHANVVKLIEVHHDRLHTYIVMELLLGGELLQRPRPFSERQAKRVMRQLASAVRYMHSRGVVHRDLKPENIVYVHQGEDSPVKIVDFGFARMKNSCEPLHTPCFTLPYAAPEVVANQEYDESCDMWSLGTILYFMLSDNPPFRTDTPNVAMRIKAGEINFDSGAWSHVSPGAKEVMKGLLMIDPNNRLTAVSLVYHSWLTTHDTTILPVTPATDTVHTDNTVAVNATHESESFRLREVDAAKLAQRRKLKRSNSSSSTSRPSSSSSTSPSSVQLRLPSGTANSAANTSTSSPSVFDFNDEVVSEYLSSLSSSSDSNSSVRLSLQEFERTAKKRTKRNADHESCQPIIPTKKHRHRRDVDSEASGSSSNGPMTRSRKRKLEQIINSDRDIGSDNSAESFESSSQVVAHDEENVHRRHKADKRPKRLATITLE